MDALEPHDRGLARAGTSPSGVDRRRSALVVGALLVLALGTLLRLQWRWLGELSSAQREETRRVLQAAVEQMASQARSAIDDVAETVRRAHGSGQAARIPLVSAVLPLDGESGIPPDDTLGFAVQHLDGTRSRIVLDGEQLTTRLFPTLVTRVLGPSDRDTYRVDIFGGEPGRPTLLYRSHPDEPELRGPPDASTELRLEPGRWIELGEDGAGWMTQGRPLFLDSGSIGSDGLDPASVTGRDALALSGGDDAPTWRIELRHRSGSLATALAGARLRNALLGAGVLAVLLAGFGFLWVAEQRARRLAERELAFVAGVSHELRTPLAVVRTAASNLARGIVARPEAVAEYGVLIEREAERVSGLVERVLRFSGGDAPLALEDADLARIVAAAVERCGPWSDRKRFTVAVDVAQDARRARVDVAALTTALHNLIENAIKYGPDGQTVRVSARRSREDGAVVLEVADTGPGVAPEDRARLFEPFYRAPSVRTGGIPGSGLGLSVAREIVRAHGGSLELVEGGSGSGATFRLCLPGAPGPDDEVDA